MKLLQLQIMQKPRTRTLYKFSNSTLFQKKKKRKKINFSPNVISIGRFYLPQNRNTPKKNFLASDEKKLNTSLKAELKKSFIWYVIKLDQISQLINKTYKSFSMQKMLINCVACSLYTKVHIKNTIS